MKTIRWGIIGCGDVTEVKSGPALQQAKNSSLVAVMRRDAEKAAHYARRHGVPKWYSDADELIRDPEVDAVYIATPPGSHEEYTVKAAKAGKPVYVEKPMARNFAECQRMIEACGAAKVPLFVAYYRRALPRFLKVRELVQNSAIGEVRNVNLVLHNTLHPGEDNPATLPWRVLPEIAGGGRFLDLASHALDVLQYMLGEITSVSGHALNQAGKYPAEDSVAACLVFAEKILCSGLWSFNSFHRADITEITGSLGRLRFSMFGSEAIELTTSQGIQTFDTENPRHIQQPLIQSIVDELNGTGKCPSTGLTAARTNWVMDEVLKEWRVKIGTKF